MSFSTADDGNSFSNGSKFNGPSVPISSGFVKVVSARVEQIHAITDSCLVPTPSACIRIVCMHFSESRASSSTRAPSSNDNMSKLSADCQREASPSKNESSIKRSPLTSEDFTSLLPRPSSRYGKRMTHRLRSRATPTSLVFARS